MFLGYFTKFRLFNRVFFELLYLLNKVVELVEENKFETAPCAKAVLLLNSCTILVRALFQNFSLFRRYKSIWAQPIFTLFAPIKRPHKVSEMPIDNYGNGKCEHLGSGGLPIRGVVQGPHDFGKWPWPQIQSPSKSSLCHQWFLTILNDFWKCGRSNVQAKNQCESTGLHLSLYFIRRVGFGPLNFTIIYVKNHPNWISGSKFMHIIAYVLYFVAKQKGHCSTGLIDFVRNLHSNHWSIISYIGSYSQKRNKWDLIIGKNGSSDNMRGTQLDIWPLYDSLNTHC